MAEYGGQKVTADVTIGNMVFMLILEEGEFRFGCSEKDRDAAYPSLSFVDCKARDTGIAVHNVPAFVCMHGQQTVTIKLATGSSMHGTGEVSGQLERSGKRVFTWNTDAWGYGSGTTSLYQSHPRVLAVLPNGEALGVLADTTHRCEEDTLVGGGSVYQVPIKAGIMDNEDLDESELSRYESQHHHDEQTTRISPDMGGSKWQLKGKRNIRILMKRTIELVDRKDSVTFDNRCNGVPIHESPCEGKGNIVCTARMNRQRLLVQQRSEELSYTYDEDDLVENDLEVGQTQSLGFGNRKYPSILKASSRDRGISNSNFISSDEDSLVMSPLMWEPDQLSQATLKGHWKESDGWFNPTYVSNFCDWMGSMSVDVDLKVQACYKGEHVPLVSLMSKLNGKAIVGHPVKVEKLEDISSDLLACSDDFCEELPNDYEKTALPPVWRTARRTIMHRVPCPPPSPALEREEASFVLYSDLGSKHPFKKLYAGHIKNKVKVIKRTSRHIRQPLFQKKFSKKLLKKVSSSSLKTRTLSSIAIEQRFVSKTSDSKQADKNVKLYGLIKAEGTVPVMTCPSKAGI